MNRLTKLAAAALAFSLCLGHGMTSQAMDMTMFKEAENFILLGDSRVCGIGYSADAEVLATLPGAEDTFIGKKDGNYIIAKGGEGFLWLRDTGLPLAMERLTPATTVVVWMGTNDLADAELYGDLLNSLSCRVMVVSCGKRLDAQAQSVAAFNECLRAKLRPEVVWLDLGDTILDEYYLEDGVHLTKEGYRKVYEKICEGFEALPVDSERIVQWALDVTSLHHR